MRVEYEFISFDQGSLYLHDAAEALASMFDIGVNVAGVSGDDLSEAFVVSGMALQFERFNPVYVAGKSGVELLRLVAPDACENLAGVPTARLGRTPEYWAGWNLAYYQASTGRSYKSIFEAVSFEEIRALYHPLHEAHEKKFMDVIEGMVSACDAPSHLRRIREAAGYSQSQLASASGVGLRSIQMYEQRQKDINKAQAAALYRLSRALHCRMEDLLEL